MIDFNKISPNTPKEQIKFHLLLIAKCEETIRDSRLTIMKIEYEIAAERKENKGGEQCE